MAISSSVFNISMTFIYSINDLLKYNYWISLYPYLEKLLVTGVLLYELNFSCLEGVSIPLAPPWFDLEPRVLSWTFLWHAPQINLSFSFSRPTQVVWYWREHTQQLQYARFKTRFDKKKLKIGIPLPLTKII